MKDEKKQEKINIMIVDDHAPTIELEKTLLEQEGYSIVSTDNGLTAIELAEQTKPDLILLDIKLPGLNGYEVCESIRANEKLQYIPIIMVTVLSEIKDRQKALEVGADDFLSKPIDKFELVSRVKSILRIKEFEKRQQSAMEEIIALQAEKVSITKSMVLGLAHEINNPLTAIIGRAELLQEDFPCETEEHKAVTEINIQATRIGEIVKKMLSMISSYPHNFAEIDIAALLLNTIKELEHKSKEKNITFVTDIESSSLKVSGDFEELAQAFFNIVSNSIDFSNAEGKINIYLRSEGADVIVSIVDYGVGIKKEDLTNIFLPFYTTKEVGSGTGLGLPIAEGIVNKHKGEIVVNSEPNHKTEVIITLPIVTEKKKILIAEDETSVLKHLKIIMKHYGYDVFGAFNGKEAIQMAEEIEPDLIIMDFKMPVLDGWEAAKIMKQNPKLKNVIIIGYTAYASKENLEKAQQNGFNEVLSKPVDLIDLKNIIKKYI